MKFGVRLPNSGPLATRENIVRVADEAERLGFHSIWVHDHILWGSEQHRTHLSSGSAEALSESQKPNFYESITTLCYLAGRTQYIKLGIAVLVLPLRDPLVVAKQLANLDVLSEGRLILGVAPGAPNITKSEFEAVAVRYEERGKITDEYVQAVRNIWQQNLATFSGRYCSFKEAQVFPKPSQKIPPILIGGGERGISPRALRRVVELGDGWIPAYLTPDEVRQGVSKIKQSSFSDQRNARKKYLVAHEIFTAVDRSSEKAVSSSFKSLGSNFVSAEEGLKRSLVGDPREITQKLKIYEVAGVDISELKFIYSDIPSLLHMMKLFSEEILPTFA